MPAFSGNPPYSSALRGTYPIRQSSFPAWQFLHDGLISQPCTEFAEKHPFVPHLHRFRRARCIHGKCRARLIETVSDKMSCFFPIIGAAIAFLVVGCNESERNRTPGHDPEASKATIEDLPIMMGIYTDGTPFFDWEGVLQHSHQSNGTLDWDNGANLKGDFKRLSDGATASINVQIKVEQEVYLVMGTYSSTAPFTLTYLGTNENDTDAITASFEAGEGSIEYRGEPPYTFEKKR